jgi:hypothetical protein
VAEAPLETRLTLAPGQNGTRKLLARYGERLVRVRYRYDAARKVRHKTVELIVETVPWEPSRRNPRGEPETSKTVHDFGLQGRVVPQEPA